MEYKINISTRRNVWRVVDLKSDNIICTDIKCVVGDDCNTCIFYCQQHLLSDLKEVGRVKEV